jgi:hypothetical protein
VAEGGGSLRPTPPGHVPRRTRVRHALNWVNLSTPLGLCVAKAGRARIGRGPDLLFLADHYAWRFPTGSAFTVGDVVISRYDLAELLARRRQLLEHEAAHSRQWAACLGLPFLPLYVASMGWSWLPGVSYGTTALDLVTSLAAGDGHGHRYGSEQDWTLRTC